MTNAVIVELPDLAATARLAARIAAALQPGDVVALTGTLGAGKTTMAREILFALGHADEEHTQKIAIIHINNKQCVRLPVVHADFYRLDDPAEAGEIGLDDYRRGAALIAEWPEKGGGFAHEAACLSINLRITTESVSERRSAIVEAGPDWLMREPWLGQ